jgi:molybdopterin-guanine dinucleotide biosynthesis protein A
VNVLDHLALVLLAGGASRRFKGRQKPLIDLGGQTIAGILLDELAARANHVYISVKNDEQTRSFKNAIKHLPANATFVRDLDRFPGDGRDDAAIFGLFSALSAVAEPFALVLSGDMPFVSHSVAALLDSYVAMNPDAVVPLWENGFLEPTLAIYQVLPTLARIERMLIAKQYQLVELVRGLANVAHVLIEDIKRLDPDLACLVNVNTERDLDQARRRFNERAGKKGMERVKP